MALYFTDSETAILSALAIMTPTGIPATLDTLARLALYRDDLGGHLARRAADDATLSAWHAVGEAERELEIDATDYLTTEAACEELREIARRFENQAQAFARETEAVTSNRDASIRFATRCAIRAGRTHHQILRAIADDWGHSDEVCAVVDSEIARHGLK